MSRPTLLALAALLVFLPAAYAAKCTGKLPHGCPYPAGMVYAPAWNGGKPSCAANAFDICKALCAEAKDKGDSCVVASDGGADLVCDGKKQHYQARARARDLLARTVFVVLESYMN